MQINQKNIFGNNTINLQPIEREFTEDKKNQMLQFIDDNGITCVRLRFEYSAEAKDFASTVASFLKSRGLSVYGENDMISNYEIHRNEFSIQKHPSDKNFAIINIGSIF